MRILVCSVNEEDTELVGFKEGDVVLVSEPRLINVPGSPSGVMGGITDRGRLYLAVPMAGFGEYPVRMFILVKNGLAIGVTRVIGFFEPSEEYEISKEELKIFEKLVKTEVGEVYVVDLESFEIPDVDLTPPAPIEMEEFEREEDKTRFLLADLDGQTIALRMDGIRGIVEWSEVNELRFGNILGFVNHAGDIVTVISVKNARNPKWCVILSEYGIPISSGEVVSGEVVEGPEKSFLIFKERKIEILNEIDLEGTVENGSR